jgi:hypothetical protein
VRYAVLPGDKTANHGNPNNVIFFLTDAGSLPHRFFRDYEMAESTCLMRKPDNGNRSK